MPDTLRTPPPLDLPARLRVYAAAGHAVRLGPGTLRDLAAAVESSEAALSKALAARRRAEALLVFVAALNVATFLIVVSF